MTSRKNINIFEFNGVNVAKHWNVAGEVFAISDCIVYIVFDMLGVLISEIHCFGDCFSSYYGSKLVLICQITHVEVASVL